MTYFSFPFSIFPFRLFPDLFFIFFPFKFYKLFKSILLIFVFLFCLAWVGSSRCYHVIIEKMNSLVVVVSFIIISRSMAVYNYQ